MTTYVVLVVVGSAVLVNLCMGAWCLWFWCASGGTVRGFFRRAP